MMDYDPVVTLAPRLADARPDRTGQRPMSGRRLDPFAFDLLDDMDVTAPKRWAVAGLLGAGEMSAWYGEPGAGKSVIVSDLAFHVAAGLEWMGRKIEQGAVLYIAAERAGLTKRRLAALRERHRLAGVPVAVVAGAPDLFTNAAHALRIAETCRELEDRTGVPVRLIVVDTLARSMPGADENTARDVSKVVQHLDKIRELTGAHLLVVHHCGKDGTRGMRGSNALLGAVDVEVCIEKGETYRTAVVTKANDGDEGEVCRFTLDSETLATDPDTGQDTTAPIVRPIDMAGQAGHMHKRKDVRLTDAEANALRMLKEVVDDRGKTLPAGWQIPASIKAVTRDEWRKHWDSNTISDSDKPDTRRKRFGRAAQSLQSKGLIGFREGLAWPVI